MRFRKVPDVLPPVSIPAEATLDKVHTIITDTSGKSDKIEETLAACREADVLCLVYAVDLRSSFDRLSAYWFPLLEKATQPRHIPIVLVGTRIDVKTESDLDELIIPMMNHRKVRESGIFVGRPVTGR
jgi:Ras family protein T1